MTDKRKEIGRHGRCMYNKPRAQRGCSHHIRSNGVLLIHLWYYALSLRAHIEQYAPDKDAGYLAMIDASINETRVQMNKLGIEVDV